MSLNKRHELTEIAKIRCRELRQNQTDAEKIFWEDVRNRKLLNKKFYRQHPLFIDVSERETFYIADYYCHEEKLVIEIDGKIHEYQKERDLLRTQLINLTGIRVIIFNNERIETDLNAVLSEIKTYFNKSPE